MSKVSTRNHGVLVLILLLLVILASWWMLASLHIGNPADTNAAHGAQAPLVIHHSIAKNTETYSGLVYIPNCQVLAAGISAMGNAPVHITLSFATQNSTDACDPTGKELAAPFSLSFSSNISSTRSVAVLDLVTINNAAAPFLVVEDK